MSLEDGIRLAITILTVLLAPVFYFWRNLVARVDALEQKLNDKADTDDVRTLIDDKVTPMKEDLKDIKVSIDKLLNHILDLKK